MKKWVAFTLALLVGAIAMPAFADVIVNVDIFKDKDKFVFEQIEKFKFVTINVNSDFRLEGAAEAQALVNQRNFINAIGVEAPTSGNLRTSDILGSILNNQGVVGVNQDVGNMVNQANVLALALTTSTAAFAEAQAEVDQFNAANFYGQSEENGGSADRRATILDSINGNVGIVGVNQNAGNMNNQTNSVALAIAVNGFVALSEAALGQINVDNEVHEFFTQNTNSILNSINQNTGIVSVNQSSGNLNNQAASVAFAATSSAPAMPRLPTGPQ